MTTLTPSSAAYASRAAIAPKACPPRSKTQPCDSAAFEVMNQGESQTEISNLALGWRDSLRRGLNPEMQMHRREPPKDLVQQERHPKKRARRRSANRLIHIGVGVRQEEHLDANGRKALHGRKAARTSDFGCISILYPKPHHEILQRLVLLQNKRRPRAPQSESCLDAFDRTPCSSLMHESEDRPEDAQTA